MSQFKVLSQLSKLFKILLTFLHIRLFPQFSAAATAKLIVVVRLPLQLLHAELARLLLPLALLRTHAVLALDERLGHLQERIVDALAGLCGGFQDLQVVGLLELEDIPVGHLDLTLLLVVLLFLAVGRPLCDISLVGEHDHVDIGAAVLLDLLQPAVDVEEAVAVRQVEDDKDTVSTLVVGLSDGSEALLARRVPDLEAHLGLVDLQRPEAEVDADG
jgi:hypothetical protein